MVENKIAACWDALGCKELRESGFMESPAYRRIAQRVFTGMRYHLDQRVALGFLA